MHVPASTRISGGLDTTTAAAAKPKASGRSFHAALIAEDAATTSKASTRTKAAREQTEPVPGHAYSEITAGPRNGMFLNTSGNKRDGQAFTLVERGGYNYHIYGTGRDRLIIRLPDKDDDAATTPAKTGTTGDTAATPATPGTTTIA